MTLSLSSLVRSETLNTLRRMIVVEEDSNDAP